MNSAPLDGPAFVLNLTQSSGQSDYLVDSVELQDTRMRHRISTNSEKQSLSFVFRQSFVALLNRAIERLDAKTMILADAEEAFELDGLRLSNMQLVSTLRDQNIRHVVIRFLSVQGTVQSLFHAAPSPTNAERSAIAVSALEDVVGRTYDCACSFEQIVDLDYADFQMSSQSDVIMSKREELLFRLALLNRAVSIADFVGEEKAMNQLPRIVG